MIHSVKDVKSEAARELGSSRLSTYVKLISDRNKLVSPSTLETASKINLQLNQSKNGFYQTRVIPVKYEAQLQRLFTESCDRSRSSLPDPVSVIGNVKLFDHLIDEWEDY